MIEKALRDEDNCTAFTAFSFDYCIIEKMLEWLEREDTDVERLAATGLCLATVTYFLAEMFQALF